MLELLGLAWTAWKLSVKRVGPYGAVLVALAVVIAFVFLRDYLEDEYPRAAEALEDVV